MEGLNNQPVLHDILAYNQPDQVINTNLQVSMATVNVCFCYRLILFFYSSFC